jgi:rRNA maturation endonuclease Nob1
MIHLTLKNEPSELSEQKMDYLVLDNTAFMSGLNINLLKLKYPELIIVVSSGIYEEAIMNPRSQRTIEVAETQGYLQIRDPSNESQSKVKIGAQQSGDIGALSDNDRDLMAVCLDLMNEWPLAYVYLMSDDYSIQNTCQHLDIRIYKFRKQGIQKKIRWEVYCPSCFRIYPPNKLKEPCEICGEPLKRRPFRGKQRHL